MGPPALPNSSYRIAVTSLKCLQSVEQLGLAKCIEDESPIQLYSAIEQALNSQAPIPTYPRMDGLNVLCNTISDLTSQRAEQIGNKYALDTQSHPITQFAGCSKD